MVAVACLLASIKIRELLLNAKHFLKLFAHLPQKYDVMVKRKQLTSDYFQASKKKKEDPEAGRQISKQFCFFGSFSFLDCFRLLCFFL